jgi:hypothetical protein
MKTLIYGMQSSGASLFAYWLAQQDNCIGVIDLHFDEVAPPIEFENVILKCVPSKDVSLERHIDSFRPDKVIFFVRNPIENYLSLSEKVYSNHGGSIEYKLSIMDSHVNCTKHDGLVRYEDFIVGRVPQDIGHPSYYEFRKSLSDIKHFNFLHSPWCKDNFKIKWGIGNIHENGRNLSILNNFCQTCPNLFNLY